MMLEEIKIKLADEDSLDHTTIKELIDILSTPSENLESKGWYECIVKLSKILSTINKDKNLLFLTNALDAFKNSHPRAFRLKQSIIHEVALAQISDRNISEAHKLAKSYLYNGIACLYPKATNEKTEYYSFRGFSEYAIEDIKNETISVAHPREFNDPLDTIFNLWLEQSIKSSEITEEEREFRLLLKKSSEYFKMRCFVEATYKNEHNERCIRNIELLDPLMWAHYANSHRGFCVRYKFEKDFFHDYVTEEDKPICMMSPMIYTDNIQIDLQQIPAIDKSVLSKSKNWEYEQETRLLYYSVCPQIAGDCPPFPAVECKGAIKAVYLGVKCSDKDRRRMEEAIGDKNIELYQMHIDDANIAKLKAQRIG